MGEVDMVALGKATQFKQGNKAGAGLDHKLRGYLQNKGLVQQCRDFFTIYGPGVLSGTEKGGFYVLREIAYGGPRIKTADQLTAIALIAKIGGLLKEQIVVETKNPVHDMTDDELRALAKESLEELEKQRATVVDAEVVSGRSGDPEVKPSGDEPPKD